MNKKLLKFIEKKMFDLVNAIIDKRLRESGYFFTEKGIKHLIKNIMEEINNEYSR